MQNHDVNAHRCFILPFICSSMARARARGEVEKKTAANNVLKHSVCNLKKCRFLLSLFLVAASEMLETNKSEKTEKNLTKC